MHIGLTELGCLISEWSTQAVLVVTSIIFPSPRLQSENAAGFFIHILISLPWRATTDVGVCLRVFLCVLPLPLGLCAENKFIIGRAFHSSITFLSGRIPQSAKVFLLYVCFVCKASIGFGCQVPLTRGWVLARGVRCVSQLWHCLTPAAFECSFKACLSECFSLHVLALFISPLPPPPSPLPLPLPPPLQLSAVFFQFTFALMSFPPHCVLYSTVHRVLWQLLFAGRR